jgi:signal peptidase II
VIPPSTKRRTQRLLGSGSGRRLGLIAAVAVTVLLLDQATKIAATRFLSGREPIEILGGLIRLGFYRNYAGANNILPGHAGLISLFAAVAIVVLVFVALRVRTRLNAVVVALLLAGAAGNLLDRMLREPGFPHGGVIDWLKLTGHTNWMNVADLAIDAAFVLVLANAILTWHRQRKEGARSVPVSRSSGESRR